jgi:hypothetical protein
MTVEKLDAKVALKLLDRLGDGGLRDRQMLRGPQHGPALGDRYEELELTEREGHEARS